MKDINVHVTRIYEGQVIHSSCCCLTMISFVKLQSCFLYLFTLGVQQALISLLRYVITVLSYDLNVAEKRMRGIF